MNARFPNSRAIIDAVELPERVNRIRVAIADDQEVAISSSVTAPTVYNVTLTLANTEYGQALPDNTKQFRFRCRTSFDVRFAFETGKVATPTAPYLTLPADNNYSAGDLNLSDGVLYLASSEAGVVVEVEVWA